MKDDQDDELAIFGGNPVRKNLLSLAEPIIGEEEIIAVEEVLRSGWIREGNNVKDFERKFSKYVGSKYAVAVSSGTAALHTACSVCGLKEGDEVIVPSFTHISTANAVLYVGATPVFAEVDTMTYNIDPADVANKITKKTRAIIPVHWGGHPANMNVLNEIAEQNNLIIIEDSCQALGASIGSKKTGCFGAVGCFSFYPSKIITTGEGGMIVTNDEDIYENAKLFRNYGQKWEQRFSHSILGYNYRISEIQAVLGLKQLDRVEDIITKKILNSKKISKGLESIEGISAPTTKPDCRHVFVHYMIQVDENEFGLKRDFLVEALNAEKIEARFYIPPVHLQPYYINRFNYKEGYLPETEKISKRVLTLPCSAALSESDIWDIVLALTKIKGYTYGK